jgi:WD40 repeat protein
MIARHTCPSAADLEKLMVGQMSEPEVEQLAEHLEHCPRCVETVRGLHLNDTLLEAARRSPAAGDPGETALEQVIQRLKGLQAQAVTEESSLAPGSRVPLSLPPVGSAPAGLPAGASTQAEGVALAPPQAADEIGRLGGYRVLKLLGAGGMGMVYLAEDTQLQRSVALKVMRPEAAKNPTARERFLREARAAARLKSDHVVTIHQVGEDGPVVFLAMELLEGLSLEDWLKKGHRPAPAQAARIGRQVALGLAAAHERGLIHRDVKPANVWLERSHQGRIKLLDFGLARGASDHTLTQSGTIVGTPAYMAPEQARGEQVDHRADLFSLGVVLYRLCTGRLPFRGENTMAMLTALAVDNPAPVREVNPKVPPRLAALIEHMLSKDPAQRPATARAVADELAAVEREAVTAPTPAEPTRPAPEPAVKITPAPVARVSSRPAGRKPALRKLVAAALLLLLAGAAAGIIVIIRDRLGNEVARVTVPEGGSVEVQEDKGKESKQPSPPGPRDGGKIEYPLAGEPLFRSALVSQPARLPGVRSWTIEPRVAAQPSTLAYRPDGRRLAVGGWDGSIRIWEPQTGRLVQLLPGDTSVYTLAWSPDGRVLAAGTLKDNRPVRLWEADTGRLLYALESPADGVTALSWSPDSRRVVAWGSLRSICFTWDATDGRLLHKVPIDGANPVAFSPDGSRLAATTLRRDVLRVWDVATAQAVTELPVAPEAVARAAWSPDGKRLSWSGSTGVHVWDLEAKKDRVVYKMEIFCHPTWAPDGQSLAFGLPGNDGAAVVHVATGAVEQRLGDPRGSVMAWSPDGKTIARLEGGNGPASGAPAWVRLYDVAANGRRSLSESPGYAQFALAPDGRVMAGAEWQPDFRWRNWLTSVDTGRTVAVLADGRPLLAWSPAGKALATAGAREGIALWGPDGKLQKALMVPPPDMAALAWSPDGRRLASAPRGTKRVLLWDIEKGDSRELGPFAAEVVQLVWLPGGPSLACEVNGAGWHFWDPDRNQLLNDPKQWQEHTALFLPDGRCLVHDGSNRPERFRLRDVATGKETELPTRSPGPPPPVNPLCAPACSADGGVVAVPAGANVEVWRGDLLRRARTLRGTTNRELRQVAVSADGKLVLGLSGARLHVWETDTGRLRGTLLFGPTWHDLAVTPEGQYTGDDQVGRGIVMVVRKEDGTQEVLEPADFEQKYGWKNDPNKVHLLKPLPPSQAVPVGEPLGPLALVSEPAELADPTVTSWTIETRSSRARVNTVAYRPDGKLLATGGQDGTIRLWDTARGELVRMLVGGEVQTLSWSADGKILAAGGGFPGGVWLWQAETGRLLRRIPEGLYAACSPDGRTLAVLGTQPANLQLRDAATERVVSSYPFPNFATALAWSPDGKSLAVGLRDKTVRLWDVGSGKETHRLEGHESLGIGGVAWSPDSKRLVTAANKEAAFLVWDAVTGKLRGRFPAAVAGDNGPTVAWSPDGKTVAVGSAGLFDPDTGRPVRPLDAGEGIFALAWSPDGQQVATAGIAGIRLHQPATGKRTYTLDTRDHNSQIWSLAWSPDGGRLALGSNSSRPLVVEAATGRHLPVPRASYKLAWSPDGKLLAANGGGMSLWDAGSGDLVRALDDPAALWADGLAWTTDGKRLAGGGGQWLRVWSPQTGKLLWQNEQNQKVLGVAWSPDGRRLATTDRGEKGAVRLWEAESGKLLHEVSLRSERLAWSPDGKLLAAGAWGDGPCLVIDDSGGVRLKLREEFSWLKGLRWSADGKTLFTLDNGGSLRAWDAATGERRQAASLSSLPGTIAQINAAWSPDGRVLARSNFFEVRLSNETGQPLGVLLPGEPFEHLAVAPDGQYRGSARVEREIRMVVQKRDGTSETLTPAEFEQKYGFKNEPEKVRLLE